MEICRTHDARLKRAVGLCGFQFTEARCGKAPTWKPLLAARRAVWLAGFQLWGLSSLRFDHSASVRAGRPIENCPLCLADRIPNAGGDSAAWIAGAVAGLESYARDVQVVDPTPRLEMTASLVG